MLSQAHGAKSQHSRSSSSILNSLVALTSTAMGLSFLCSCRLSGKHGIKIGSCAYVVAWIHHVRNYWSTVLITGLLLTPRSLLLDSLVCNFGHVFLMKLLVRMLLICVGHFLKVQVTRRLGILVALVFSHLTMLVRVGSLCVWKNTTAWLGTLVMLVRWTGPPENGMISSWLGLRLVAPHPLFWILQHHPMLSLLKASSSVKFALKQTVGVMLLQLKKFLRATYARFRDNTSSHASKQRLRRAQWQRFLAIRSSASTYSEHDSLDFKSQLRALVTTGVHQYDLHRQPDKHCLTLAAKLFLHAPADLGDWRFNLHLVHPMVARRSIVDKQKLEHQPVATMLLKSVRPVEPFCELYDLPRFLRRPYWIHNFVVCFG